MSGIAGIALPGQKDRVAKMLDSIAHRGTAGRNIIETEHATLGIVWNPVQAPTEKMFNEDRIVSDEAGDGHFARAQAINGKMILSRDELGVAPLYHGRTDGKALCFASEVKALAAIGSEAKELPPGHRYDGNTLEQYFQLKKQPPMQDTPEVIARELRRRLDDSVRKRVGGQEVGSWLSGGLDSSTLASLARRHAKKLYTFSAGLPGAPDLEFAAEMAKYLGSEHHQAEVTLERMLAVLPDVIYHLENFDALLVRSSITNFIVAKLASEYVPAVLSGESGDELFGGYDYLKSLDLSLLPDELIDITGRLHNTAFQRVDRSASAHGTVAHVGISDPAVIDYALRIPPKYKIRDGVEKWILRQAMEDALPERIFKRTKAKFWEGAGVVDVMARHADTAVTDADFARERQLGNGWVLNTKEELMYYRVFRERFGGLADLDWMGRTKGAPVA